MRSAATAAAWMEAMVFSRLITTPLRRPSEGASPTPMMLRAVPGSSDSAMTTATRLVPRSRPTVRFRRDKTGSGASWLERGLELAAGCWGLYRLLGGCGLDFVGRGAKSGTPCGSASVATVRLTPPFWPNRLQVVPADRSQVVEDPDSERDYRGDGQIDAQLVAEVGQAARQCHVGQQAAEEDSRLERPCDVCLERAEDRVERREQGDRRVPRVRDRDGDRRQQPEQDPQDREHDRDDDYLHIGDGAGVGGFSLEWYPTAGSVGFITFTYSKSVE